MKTHKRIIGAITLAVFLVAAGTMANAQDVAKAAPNIYKPLADSLGIRLFEITFPPGVTAPMHSHPNHAVYVISGGTLEIATNKGEKQVMELKTGSGFVFGPETHTATNTGKTTVRAIVMEVRQ